MRASVLNESEPKAMLEFSIRYCEECPASFTRLDLRMRIAEGNLKCACYPPEARAVRGVGIYLC